MSGPPPKPQTLDKVSLGVKISKELNEKLRKHITERYGSYRRGLLSEVVEKALTLYLEGKCIDG